MKPIQRNHSSKARGPRIPYAVLDQLVADAGAPSDGLLAASDLDAPLELLGERIIARRPGEARSTFRARGAVGLLFAALTLFFATGALAGMFSTHTGMHPKPGTENDASELLRTDAPDFPASVKSAIADIPFPPGSASLEARAAADVRLIRRPGPELVQAALMKTDVSTWAVCAWREYWLGAHRAGNRQAAALAADRLAQVANADRRDTFWRLYVIVAKREAAGDASAPADFQGFSNATCPAVKHFWVAK